MAGLQSVVLWLGAYPWNEFLKRKHGKDKNYSRRKKGVELQFVFSAALINCERSDYLCSPAPRQQHGGGVSFDVKLQPRNWTDDRA